MKKVGFLLACVVANYSTCAPKKKKCDVKTHKSQLQQNEYPSEKERVIEIINGIEPSMLEYHYFGTHKPTKFSISINENQIDAKKSCKVPVKQNHINVRYDYEFAQGLYKGSKIVDLAVDPQAQKVVLNFSWKDPLRISAQHAKAESIKTVKKS